MNGDDDEGLSYESVAGGRTSPLVASFRNRADETTLFGYDALGRLVSKDMPGAELDISFGYDLLGRTIGASQAGDSQVYDYDALGRQLSQAGASGTYSSRYDPAGRRTRITHPDGFFVTQEYLVTGEMTKIRENGGFVLAAFDYDDLGRRDRLVLGNGAVTDYGYDAVSRLETLGHDFAGTASDNLVTFTYNAASQIETRLATNDLYAWTGHGNGTTTYVADGLNRLTSQTTAGLGTTSFVHDARGNRLNDGARTYGYDSENKSRGVATAPYHYDPLGRLSGAVNSPGTPPAIAYESYIDRLVAERTPGTLTPQRRHVFGPGVDEPLVWYEGSDRRFLTADERGSIVAVSDGSGVVRNVNRYDEYGQTQRTDPYYLSRFGFTGQRYFGGHGLYHYKNRMYDPKTGRFMQPDPIGYEGGLNLYAYVGADPVNFSDPLGMAPNNKKSDKLPPKCISDCGQTLRGGALDGQRRQLVSGNSPTLFQDASGRWYGYDSRGNQTYVSGYSPWTAGGVSGSQGGREIGSPGVGTDENGCPAGNYSQYSVGVSAAISLLLGLDTGIQIGVSIPDAPTLTGTQFFVSGQGGVTGGIGGFLGAGVTGGVANTGAPLPMASAGGFGYLKGDIGWGLAVGAGYQGSESSSATSAALPVPKLGAGFGAYAGVGVGYGGTLATKPALCGE